MTEFRCFRNYDPPRLAEAWREANLGPRGMQPMTAAFLESAVFSKPYFEREGLIVAIDRGRLVGFAHAAFGPQADRRTIDTAVGTTMLVVVVPHPDAKAIGDGLLALSEAYLRGRGAQTLLGGGDATMRGFYFGLYGGADLPGILDSSPAMQDVFVRAGYQPAGRIAVLRRSLSGFRPAVNRHHLSIRRLTTLHVTDEPPRRHWWEAATTAGVALRRYELMCHGNEVLGRLTTWDLMPLSAAWGVPAAGLIDFEVQPKRRKEGLGSYLLAETLHDLADEGVSVAETQVAEDNVAGLRLCEKLGFKTVDRGTVFRRPSA